MAPNSALFSAPISALGKNFKLSIKNQLKYERTQSEEFRVGTSQKER